MTTPGAWLPGSLDTSEFAELAVESAEGQVPRLPGNLQNQAV
jgi:hypothetical protein